MIVLRFDGSCAPGRFTTDDYLLPDVAGSADADGYMPCNIAQSQNGLAAV